MAVPGLVIALASRSSSSTSGRTGYESAALLVLAYAMLFFPLALVAVRTSLAQAPSPWRTSAAHSAARARRARPRHPSPRGPGPRCGILTRVPLGADRAHATLVLIPSGVETLSTQFWAYQTDFAYGQAAPYAALMIAIAAVPSFVLGPLVRPPAARRGVRA